MPSYTFQVEIPLHAVTDDDDRGGWPPTATQDGRGLSSPVDPLIIEAEASLYILPSIGQANDAALFLHMSLVSRIMRDISSEAVSPLAKMNESQP
jgi:hypothetical protein